MQSICGEEYSPQLTATLCMSTLPSPSLFHSLPAAGGETPYSATEFVRTEIAMQSQPAQNYFYLVPLYLPFIIFIHACCLHYRLASGRWTSHSLTCHARSSGRHGLPHRAGAGATQASQPHNAGGIPRFGAAARRGLSAATKGDVA